MKDTKMIQSFMEFASGSFNTPYLANLCDAIQNADTPNRRYIAEWEVDKGVDALKDLKHSDISRARGYANEWQRESDKNILSAVAEEAKKQVKDFLRARGLLVQNRYTIRKNQ